MHIICIRVCAGSIAHVTLRYCMDHSPPGSSIHGILQARILEWVAMPSSRESFRPRDRTHVPCTGRQILNHWTTREACIGAHKQAGEGVWRKREEEERQGRREGERDSAMENTGAELRQRPLVLISGPFYNMSTNKSFHILIPFACFPHQSLKSVYRVAELLLSTRNV